MMHRAVCLVFGVHPQAFWIEIYTHSRPRRGKTASRKLTINNEKLNLYVGFHRKHAVPEGGEQQAVIRPL